MTSSNHTPSPGPFGNKIFYGWVVVAASVVIACVLLGIRFSFGVFFKSLAGEFNLTRAATSSVFSVYMIIFAVFAVGSGWALDKYGPRLVVVLMGLFTGLSLLMTSQVSSLWQLYLSYSVLLAIGTGGTMPVLISVVSRWFYKKRGFALGIATSGSGLGALVVAPFAAYLISSFDWRISYIVLGVFACLVVISLALLLRRDPAEIGALPDGVKSDVGRAQVLEKEEIHDLPGFSLSGAFKTSSFWLMLAVWLLFAFCLTLIMTHVVAYATDIGISTIEASTVLGVMGGVNILTRLLMGPASDVVGRKIPGVFCAVIGAVALVWLIYSHNLWMFYLFAVVFGVSWGGIGVTLASMVGDIFGGRSLGTIMGVLETGFAMGSAIGPAVGGFVFDVTGNYTLAFAAAAAIMLIAGVLISLTKHETKV